MGKMGKTAALAAAFMMLLTAACTDRDKNSSLTAKESGERTGYKTLYYSFTVDKAVKNTDKKEYDGTPILYTFEGGSFSALSVRGFDRIHITPAAEAEMNADQLKTYDDVKEVSFEVIDGTPYNCAAFHYFDTEQDEYFSSYILSYQTIHLYAEGSYKKADKDNARAELKRIVSSAEYISDEYLPTDTQTYDTDFFSLSYEPDWTVEKERKKDLTDDIEVNVSFRPTEVGSKDQYYGPAVNITVFNTGGTDDAETLADRKSDSLASSDRNEVERYMEQRYGFDTEVLACHSTSSVTGLDLMKYFYCFDYNGMVYVITESVNTGSEKDQEMVDGFLSGITFKELSEDEISVKQSEREDARYTSYSMHGASFELDSRLSTGSSETDSEWMNFDGAHSDLSVSRTVSSESAEDARDEEASYVYWRYEDDPEYDTADLLIMTDKEKLGDYFLQSMTYDDLSTGDTHRTFCYNDNGVLWKFEFSYEPVYKDESERIIEEFFESFVLEH